ncbi:MAG: glycosyltransferase N-terminal domain-containing protein, partial [Succinatimonas sp.]|nr:glycosyltransferase N-terminal domain-containing protein [Succinatimonas sp.]
MKIKSALTLLTYRGLTTLVAPLGAMFIAYKKRRDAPYGKRIFELLGFYKETASNCIWFHGASVGEINALKPLVTEYVTTHLG